MTTDKCPYTGDIDPRFREEGYKLVRKYQELKSLDPPNELLKYLEIDGDGKGFFVNKRYVNEFVMPDEKERFMDASNWNWEIRIKACERYIAALESEIKRLSRAEYVVGFDRVECGPIKVGEILRVKAKDEEVINRNE